MKFEDAVKRSIKEFMRGKMPKITSELAGEDLFHTPEYFDELEEELLGEVSEEDMPDESL